MQNSQQKKYIIHLKYFTFEFIFNIIFKLLRQILNIDYASKHISSFYIQVFNSIGKLVFSKEYTSSNYLQIQLDVSNYSSGVHQINLVTQEHYINRTIIIK